MRRKFASVSIVAAAVLLALGAGTAFSQDAVSADVTAEASRLWFVELSSPPVADGSSLTTVQAEKAAFRRAALAAGIRFTERRSFDVLFNGMSIELDLRDRTKLQSLGMVKALYPVEVIQAPAPEPVGGGSELDLASALTMTGAGTAQSALGLSGAGIKVAVMDTGVDIDHPDFGGGGVNGGTAFPSARITHGYDFVGDAFNADSASPTYNPVPAPDGRPDDCNGHGTHVAGIVGANGLLKGVAPNVTFGAYRVFGCNGSTTADIMVAAMERALADGMHVLNMSIGSAFQWPQYPTAQAANRLVNKGMVVVASIGNSGANGIYSSSAPGVGHKVIGTASFDNLITTQKAFSVQPGGNLVGFNTAGASPPAPTTGSLPMARTGTTASTADGCVALPAGSLSGTAVLIRRGTCSFFIKASNAQNAGASAVVLYNNAAGELNPTVAGVPAITIPVVAVNAANGALLDGKIAAGPTTMTWGAPPITTAVANGGLISSFSSYGLAPDLSIKPDIGAPGGLIFSTVPLEAGAYSNNSGTSMASPHVAGSVALLLQARPNTPAQAVRGLLQNNADPKPWFGNPGLGFLDNVHRQGAGMLDVVGAITSTTKVEPSSIAAGEGAAGPVTSTLTIENNASTAVTYNLSAVNALSTGASTFAPAFSTSNAGVAFSAASVTVPANASATVSATITPASAPAGGIYGGYVVLTDAADSAKVLRVPFAGYIGDYQARQVLVPTASGFPWLTKTTNGANFSKNVALTPYTMVGFDIPFFAIHLDHQSRRMRLEAFDAVTGKAWHRVSDDEYLGRNSTPTGIFAFAWDGSTFSGKGKNGSQLYTVPNGQYVVKVSVLKALGNDADPAHWESWTSPVITIARP